MSEFRWRLTGFSGYGRGRPSGAVVAAVLGILVVLLLSGSANPVNAASSTTGVVVQAETIASASDSGAVQIAQAQASLAEGLGPAGGQSLACSTGSSVGTATCSATGNTSSHPPPSDLKWESVTSPTARVGTVMAYDPADQYVILFGGYNGSIYLGDTWEFYHNMWVDLTPSGGPSPRDNATMAFDAAIGSLVLFGGYDGHTLGDTWTFTGGVWSQLSPATSPSPRQDATMSYDVATGQLVLFGGMSATGTALGDTWTFVRGQWTELNIPGSSPSARWGSASTYDTAEGFILLFGGFTGSTYLGDTWAFEDDQWVQLFPSPAPPARFEGGLAYDNITDQAVLFGGASCSGGSCKAYGDTWTYANGSWTQIIPKPGVQTPGLKYLPYGSPAARQSFGMTFDASNHTVVVFGGMVDGDRLGTIGIQSFGATDTWTYTPAGWDQVLSESEFDWAQLPGRVGAGLAWDPTGVITSGARALKHYGYSVAFGGSTGYGPNGETWVFLSYPTPVWAEIFPTVSPSPRSYMAMAYDPHDNYVVLFGGMSATGVALGDTWTFQNGNWTELSLKTAPSPRYGAMMTYDYAGGFLLLYGGTNGTAYYSDTWEFQGGHWTSVPDIWGTPVPTARAFGGLAWDNNTGYVTLFGGTTGSAALGDTWKFLDDMWIQIDTGNSGPEPEWGMSMVNDSVGNSIFLFGGCSAPSFDPMAPSCASGDTLGVAWKFTSEWSIIDAKPRLTAIPASPVPRFLAAAIDDEKAPSNLILLVGGMSASGLLMTDRWAYQGDLWNPWSPTLEPSARYGAIIDFDDRSQDVVMFGGVGVMPDGQVGYLDDTWLWDPEVWGEANSSLNPSPRAFGASAYFGLYPSSSEMEWKNNVSSYNYTIMFGGYGPNGYLGDTWQWEGSPGHGQWKELFPTTAPSARANESMTYDPASNQIVLFGGQNAGGYLGDTWVFSCVTEKCTSGQWTELNIPGPSPRASAAMAYDSEGNCVPSPTGTPVCSPTFTGYIVLFGGKGASGALGDTWELTWNGLSKTYTWVQLHPVASPSARYGAGITDGAQPTGDVNTEPQAILLVAGTNGSAYFNDSWEFEAGNWTLVPDHSPGLVPVAYAVLGNDDDDGHPLIFGGINAGGISRQFWEFKLGP